MSHDNTEGAKGAQTPIGHATTAYEPEGREDFTLLRLHSEGGIGRVWVAQDAELGREVALKELKTDLAGHGAVRARFTDEARITGQLEHPGVVPVYRFVEGDDKHPAYYTMRLIRGRTLRDAVAAYHRERRAGREGPLALRELLTSFIAVCNTVAYAHARGVLHRDLKPENIVLGDFGEVIVLDWGLAKLMGRAEPGGSTLPVSVRDDAARGQTIAGQVLGTPAYLAPEQAEGRLDLLDERTDVYGLGAVLYEILAGEPPFSGQDTGEILRRVVHEPVVPPRQRVGNVPAALEAVCLKALAKRPAERYALAREVGREVEHVLADEPVSAWREPWRVRARRWLSRHHTATTVTAATVLVGTLTLGVSTVRLTAANEREREARESERQARVKAEESLQLAKDAVDKGFTRVSETVELKAHGLEKLRRDLLGQARDFYEHLVAAHRDEPGLQEERARAYLRLGLITAELGDRKQAIVFETEAKRLFGALARERPAETGYQEGLAGALEALGENYYELGSVEEAQKADESALAIREQLVRQSPESADERFRLAMCLNQLGLVYSRGLGHPPDGQRLMNRALDICQTLAREDPAKVTHRLAQADILRNLARSHNDAVDYPGAVAILERELVLREALVKGDPGAVAYQDGLGNCVFGIAVITGNLRQLDRMRANAERAIAIYERLSHDHPDVPSYREKLGRARGARGGAMAMMGDYRGASTETERAVAIAPDDGLILYNSACAFSNCTAAVRRDAKLSAAERDGLAEQYARRAMELLQQAKGTGYFNAVARVRHLWHDPDLEAIRQRDDFKKLLSEFHAVTP